VCMWRRIELFDQIQVNELSMGQVHDQYFVPFKVTTVVRTYCTYIQLNLRDAI
jgi:hypothetical protein